MLTVRLEGGAGPDIMIGGRVFYAFPKVKKRFPYEFAQVFSMCLPKSIG